MTTVLLIPGVGGHPSFHGSLIEALESRHRVHTAPHGDFFSGPYTTLAQHIDYWVERTEKIAAEDFQILAISFGTHIVPGLLQRIACLPKRVIMISPWIPGSTARCALRVLASAPAGPASRLLSKCLKHWTDRQAPNGDELARLRSTLYDDHSLVARRWLNRVTLMTESEALSWDWIMTAAKNQYFRLLFGRDEILYKIQKNQLQSFTENCPLARVVLVPGGHEIGTFGSIPVSAALLNTIET